MSQDGHSQSGVTQDEVPETYPHLAGRHTPDGHVLPVRIYFEDTDFSGVVYHGSYVRFLERGRSDYVRLLGVHHSELHAGETGESIAFAVHRMEIDFKRPARIDDAYELVRARVGEDAALPLFNGSALGISARQTPSRAVARDA